MAKCALQQRQRRLHPVTISGGGTVGAVAYGLRVPRRDLVLTLRVALETGRIRFAAALPGTAVLIHETLAFRVKITNAANDTYDAWREGEHDDLVLAVALATWYAERHGGKVKRGRLFDIV